MIAPVLMAFLATQGTVVLVHGAGGGGWEYAPWRPRIERAGYKFLAPDLVPVGGDYATTTLADYEEQVVAWCEGHRGPLVLVGASMGGALVLRVAARVEADAVILVNPVPPEPLGRTADVPDVVRWAGGPIEDTRAALPDGTERVIAWAAERWRDESGVVIRELRDGYTYDGFSAPTLVMISGQDTDIPPRASRNLAAQLDADVIEYPEASHIGPLMGRRAHRVAQDVVDWLKRRL